jgi:hypothetical protein
MPATGTLGFRHDLRRPRYRITRDIATLLRRARLRVTC